MEGVRSIERKVQSAQQQPGAIAATRHTSTATGSNSGSGGAKWESG